MYYGCRWPDYDELIRAKVPVYRFTQKAGDLVWVGGGCVHWVQSTGWCNNIAWNVGPTTSRQMEMAIQVAASGLMASDIIPDLGV